MDAEAIEVELLGAEAPVKTAALADGTEARVGLTVYFTPDGAQKVVDDMFAAVGAKSLGDFVAKTAPLFGKQVSSDSVDAYAKQATNKLRSLSAEPLTILAVRDQDRIDVQSTRMSRPMTGLPSSFFFVKEDASGALDFLKRKRGRLPVWGWVLAGLGAAVAAKKLLS